ncbi:hypothetical protein AAXE64_27065 [Priestia megaterium]
MTKELNFYYRIEKEAGLGINTETGEDTEVYMQRTYYFEKPLTPEKENQLKALALLDSEDIFGVDHQYITPISKSEYDRNTEEDDNEPRSGPT